MAVKLAHLISDLEGAEFRGDLDLDIEKVTADSRQVGPRVVFVAVRGSSGDGHQYLEAVAAAGCPAVVVEEAAGEEFAAVVTMGNTRPAPALLARRLYGRPDLALITAGVTGTNGKTTVAFLLRELLGSLAGPCGLLGTICYDDGNQSKPAPLTTPAGPLFYEWLARMRDGQTRSVAMEISSHALDQDRTAGLGLDLAVMTNLGRDHLDYHQDMRQYLQAKARILDLLRPDGEGPRGRPGLLVVNADDGQLGKLDTADHPVIRFSAKPGSSVDADLQVKSARLNLDGTQLVWSWRGGDIGITSPLVGRYNVENLCAAMAGGLGLGFAAEDCAAALAKVSQVLGRLERIALPNGAIAVVDYAHTHDALEAALGACDELGEGRILAVFGCGGDRDRGKRPLMGEVAARWSDLVWITSDNPRSEDPRAICQDILSGYEVVPHPRSTGCSVVVDRTAGIEAALAASAEGDIVVVAGKGHEDYQLIGDRKLDLDDRIIIRNWVSRQDGHV